MKLSLFLEPFGRIHYDFYPQFLEKWKNNLSTDLLQFISSFEPKSVTVWVTISYQNQIIGFCIIRKGKSKDVFESIIQLSNHHTIPLEVLESYWVEALKDYMMTIHDAKQVEVIINEQSTHSITLTDFKEEQIENHRSRIIIPIDKKQSAQEW